MNQILRAVGLGLVLALFAHLTDSTTLAAGGGYLLGSAAGELGLFDD